MLYYFYSAYSLLYENVNLTVTHFQLGGTVAKNDCVPVYIRVHLLLTFFRLTSLSLFLYFPFSIPLF